MAGHDPHRPPSPAPWGLLPTLRGVSLARWGSVLACGVVAAAVVLAAGAVLAGPLGPLAGPLGWSADPLASNTDPLGPPAGPRSGGAGATGPGLVVVVVAVLAAAVLWRFGRGRWRAMLGLRHGLGYPPIWVAAAAGVAALWALDRLAAGLPGVPPPAAALGVADLPLWASTTAAGAILLPPALDALSRWWARAAAAKADARRRGVVYPTDEHGWPTTFEGWRAWARDDAPIDSERDDRFGMGAVAERMARRLGDGTGEASIALIGPKGSGKSSILRLVRRRLEASPSVEMVCVSLWPYDTPEAAMRGVLDELVRALARHTGTLALTGLPGRYLAAVDHLAGRLGVLAALAGGNDDPMRVLERLDRIAAAAGVRLVLAIEDFERFERGEAMEATGEIGAGDGERRPLRLDVRRGQGVEPLRALLHQLHARERVTVVLATTRLLAEFDIEKLARTIERVPAMPRDAYLEMVRRFKETMLLGHAELIDATQGVLSDADPRGPPRPDHSNAYLLADGPPSSVLDAMREAVSTPRTAKSAFRHAIDVWERISGEIDPSDLIVAATVRAASDTVYAALSDNANDLRLDWAGQPEGACVFEATSNPRQRVAAALVAVEDVRYPETLAQLIVYLFPTVQEQPSDLNDAYRYRYFRPQRVLFMDHTDYWGRMEAMDILDGEGSDQQALRAINAWNTSQSGDLPNLLVDPKAWPAAVHFALHIRRDHFVDLVGATIDAALEQCAPVSDPYNNFPGVRPLQDILLQWKGAFISYDAGQLKPVIEERIPGVVRENLRMAIALLDAFAPLGDTNNPLLGPDARGPLYNLATTSFVDAFSDEDAGNLVAAMPTDRPGTLKTFLVHVVLRKPSVTQVPECWQQWQPIAGLLLRCAEQRPREVGTELAMLVTHFRGNLMTHAITPEQPFPQQHVSEFPENQARALFDLHELAECLQHVENAFPEREDFWEDVELARRWAKHHLSKPSGPQAGDGRDHSGPAGEEPTPG